MKTRKYMWMAVFLLIAVLSAGCSSKALLSEEEKANASILEGTVDEIKDFMFVAVSEEGEPYLFPFEEMPKGLKDIEVGDAVRIYYTGELSIVDPFIGEILAVEKQ